MDTLNLLNGVTLVSSLRSLNYISQVFPSFGHQLRPLHHIFPTKLAGTVFVI